MLDGSAVQVVLVGQEPGTSMDSRHYATEIPSHDGPQLTCIDVFEMWLFTDKLAVLNRFVRLELPASSFESIVHHRQVGRRIS